jgi:branched-chain amino acid transport system substrate-binding protein
MNKTTKIILWLIAAIIVIGGIYYGVSRKPAEEQVIKVGAIFPLSGKYGYIGEYLKSGAELAKDELNKKGGIKGKRLEIVYEDSQADTTTGINAYKKLSEVEGIKNLFTTISGVTLGIAPLAEQNKNLVFCVGSASLDISKAGDYIFRHNLLPSDEAKILAEFIFKDMGLKEIGMIHVNNDAGVSYKNTFENSFKELGGEIKIIETHEPKATDYKTQLTKIKESGVKGVVAFSYSAEVAQILKQSKELGLNVQYFGIYDVESPKLLETAGDAAEGLIYTHYYDPQSSREIAKKYTENYKKRYQKESEAYAALMYDSVRVLAEAMKRCQNPQDPTCIKNELYKIKNFPGVTGDITFDSNGDTEKAIIIKTVKNGQFAPYKK